MKLAHNRSKIIPLIGNDYVQFKWHAKCMANILNSHIDQIFSSIPTELER